MQAITTREYFAANAGDPPNWFVHIPEEYKGLKYPDWREIKDESDQTLCMDWTRDGCYDLPDHLQWFSDKYEQARKENHEHKVKDTISRYFQWKTYYADNLLKQLSK